MGNRLPLLRNAAMKALMAIQDNAISQRVSTGEKYGKEEIAWLIDRNEQTGMTPEQRLQEAHGLLQEALRLFEND